MVAKARLPTTSSRSRPTASLAVVSRAPMIRVSLAIAQALTNGRSGSSPDLLVPSNPPQPPPPTRHPIGQKLERLGPRVVEHAGGERATDHRSGVEADAAGAQLGLAAHHRGVAVHEEAADIDL